jgi:hypothetical protein
MSCLDGDKSLIFFDSEDDDDWAAVLLDHHRLSPCCVDQPPEIVFRVLGGLGLHRLPRRLDASWPFWPIWPEVQGAKAGIGLNGPRFWRSSKNPAARFLFDQKKGRPLTERYIGKTLH